MFILHIFDTMQSGLQSAASSYSKSDLETVLDDFFDLFITEHVYTTNSLGALRAQYAEASRQYSLSIFYCPPAQDSHDSVSKSLQAYNVHDYLGIRFLVS